MLDELINVTAVIPTRGNIDINPILDSIPDYWEKIIWNNKGLAIVLPPIWSLKPRMWIYVEDLSVYGRYKAAMLASNNTIYTQDDDCIVPIDKIIESKKYEVGKILANMPHDHGNYYDSCLVGWGALFDKRIVNPPFLKYLDYYPISDDYLFSDIKTFYDCSDVIFTTLNEFERIDVGHENFEYAYGEDRMYNQSDHDEKRKKILERCRIVKNVS